MFMSIPQCIILEIPDALSQWWHCYDFHWVILQIPAKSCNVGMLSTFLIDYQSSKLIHYPTDWNVLYVLMCHDSYCHCRAKFMDTHREYSYNEHSCIAFVCIDTETTQHASKPSKAYWIHLSTPDMVYEKRCKKAIYTQNKAWNRVKYWLSCKILPQSSPDSTIMNPNNLGIWGVQCAPAI